MTDKNKGGRPPRFKTPDELRAAVDAYFEACKGRPMYDKDGKPVIDRNGRAKLEGERPPTMTGLTYALGYTNRHVFAQQKRRGADFANVVQYARLRVENYNEMRLFDPDGYKGAAYILRLCFGWEGPTEAPTTPPDVRVIEAPPADAATVATIPAAADPAADADAATLPAHSLHVDLLN